MSSLDDTPVIASPVEPLVEEGTADNINSLLDVIKQEVQELADATDVYIPVKGYEKSGIAIKYRAPNGGKELDAIARKIETETKDKWARNINTAIETMIALCSGVYCKLTGVEDYVMLDPGEVGIPCRFDSRLAEIVGLSSDATARATVKKLFGNNELAIVDHAERLNRWLTNTKADLEVEVWQLGN